ncbi:MAG: hypothetical protein NVS4B11_30370 [Ktedonobacteraceae bacterium]
MRTVPLASPVSQPTFPIQQSGISQRFLIMLCICILSVLFAIGSGIVAFTRTSGTHTVTHATVPPSVSKPEGVAWFYNVRGQDDGVSLHLSFLPKLVSGTVYVGWLINPYRPDQILAVGPIVPDRSGQATLQSNSLPAFNVQVQNLRHVFTHVAVTSEKAGMQWLKPAGPSLLQGAIDQKTLTGMAPLFTRSPYTPNQIALLSGLQTQTHELARWLTNMLDAQQRNEVGNVRVDLLRFIYLLEGAHGAEVARLHIASQQNVISVGDGVGLLSTNANCQHNPHMCGYLDMIHSTVQVLVTRHLIAQASAQKVLPTLATINQLSQSLRRLATSLVTLSKLDTPTLHMLTTLEVQTDALLNGSDHDGDGSIDPVPGEAATAQLYTYIQQLGAIRLA